MEEGEKRGSGAGFSMQHRVTRHGTPVAPSQLAKPDLRPPPGDSLLLHGLCDIRGALRKLNHDSRLLAHNFGEVAGRDELWGRACVCAW